jgi:mannosyltransferase OCH1-like enzyme
MPERYAEYGELWRKLNPDLTLWDWDEEEILDGSWINRDVLHDLYKNSKKPGADIVAYYTQVADVVDYELVHHYGGWYFNTDLKPIKSLDVLQFEKTAAALAMEDDIHPVNMAMYAPPSNGLMAKIIELLPQRYFGMPGAYMNATTGVQLIQHALSAGFFVHHLFPRNVFNPIHWSEFDYGAVPEIDRQYPPETVAVHEWLHRTNQRGQRVLED